MNEVTHAIKLALANEDVYDECLAYTLRITTALMPKDNLTILGERLRAARNKANLTQEQISDRSHVSIKHIAGIEKGQKNPSFEILQALAEALDLSLDNLIEKNLSAEEQGLNQLKAYYHSCPPEMRETLLNTIQAFTKELTALAEKMDKD